MSEEDRKRIETNWGNLSRPAVLAAEEECEYWQSKLKALQGISDGKSLVIKDLEAKIKELQQEVASLNAELMDDDPFHSVTTERSAEDWKRMHDRVYEMAIETEAKLKERDQEIEKLKFSDNAGNERIQELHRQLKERDELLELMAEKASHLVHLHGCEQEGLMSGKPTFQQWVNAVGSLQEVLTRYSNLKAK